MARCKSLPTLMEMNFKKLCREATRPNLANSTEYRQLIGVLIFLVNTRLDICYVVNTLSQFITEPLHFHWITAKYILRYLHGTTTLVLRYSTGDVRLHGYTNVYWEGNVVDMQSMSRCCFSLVFSIMSWMSKKQKSIALSTTEVEYIVASMVSCEVVWLRNLWRAI